MPTFVRFVRWVGPRKGWFLVAHGCAFVVLMLVALQAWIGDLWFSLILAATSFPVGLLFGWFMWELFIWPTLAFYPRNPERPSETYSDKA